MKTETPINADTIMVLALNKEKINADITASLQKEEKNKGINFEIRGTFAFLAEGNTTIMLDDECCYQEDKKSTFGFSIYKAKTLVKKEGDSETFSVSMFPSYEIEVSRDQLLKFCDEPISLKQFMANRYRYNLRIMGNEKAFIKRIFGVTIDMPQPAYAR